MKSDLFLLGIVLTNVALQYGFIGYYYWKSKKKP